MPAIAGCEHHERVAADIDRQQRWIGDVQGELRAHANGGSQHVTRREVDGLRADVDKVCESVQSLAERVAELRTGLSWWDRTLLPVITAAAVWVVTHYLAR